MDLSSLPWEDGKINPSGIKTIAYFIPKRDIKTFPQIDHMGATTADTAVNYAGDFELHTGKTWKQLYSTQGKGSASFEVMGEKDCKMFTNKAILMYPDLTDEAKALAKGAANSNLIFIIPMPGKRFIVIGGADYDVTVSPTGTTGDAPGSAKGLTINIEAPDVVPMPGYKGVLKLEAAELDCETDVLTTTP